MSKFSLSTTIKAELDRYQCDHTCGAQCSTAYRIQAVICLHGSLTTQFSKKHGLFWYSHLGLPSFVHLVLNHSSAYTVFCLHGYFSKVSKISVSRGPPVNMYFGCQFITRTKDLQKFCHPYVSVSQFQRVLDFSLKLGIFTPELPKPILPQS